MKQKEIQSDDLTPAIAYQMGRVDALLGDEPSRFSAAPWTGNGPPPDFHCAVTKTEARAWPAIREHYQLGYASQKSQIAKPAVKNIWADSGDLRPINRQKK